MLLHRFAAAIALVAPASCGADAVGTAADSGPEINCNGGFEKKVVQYTRCPDVGADAALDAEPDAAIGDAMASDAADADASAPPPLACFATCMGACQQLMTGPPYGGYVTNCTDDAVDGGAVTATCQISHLCGRRPAGLERARARNATALAQHLAISAWMEAASVTAFQRMAIELRAHGAPTELVRAAECAADDEVRHTRTMTRLARRHGAVPPTPRVRRRNVRSLEAIARENAVEGCVRELYGALVARWQATHAKDANVRRAMTVIAEDERQHAALAMAVAAWIEPRLSSAASARVAREKSRSIEELRRELAKPMDPSLIEHAGLPHAGAAVQLHASLRDSVWESRSAH